MTISILKKKPPGQTLLLIITTFILILLTVQSRKETDFSVLKVNEPRFERLRFIQGFDSTASCTIIYSAFKGEFSKTGAWEVREC